MMLTSSYKTYFDEDQFGLSIKGIIKTCLLLPVVIKCQRLPTTESVLKDTNPRSPNFYELSAGYKCYTKCQAPDTIALTFDDGPSNQHTGLLLDLMKRENIVATFFVIGSILESDPGATAVIKRVIDEGHTIGSHTYSHRNLKSMTVHQIQDDVNRAASLIRRATSNRELKYIRAPYGDLTAEALEQLVKMGYTVVNWNFDSLDWHIINADREFEIIQSNAKAGQTYIILFHDIYAETVNVMERVIRHMKSLNYKFVGMDECLGSLDSAGSSGTSESPKVTSVIYEAENPKSNSSSKILNLFFQWIIFLVISKII